MSTEAQRVVVIQDGSREVSLSAIEGVLHGFSLKPGDTLTILSVLHQVNNPSTLSFTGGAKTMGYKSRIDSSMFGSSQRIVENEVARKKKEYENNVELIQISKEYEMQKIEFKIEVDAGPSPKVVALKAARRLSATWVILDRQMKKDKKYFVENLSCGISRMKRDSSIEQLRGPKVLKIIRSLAERRHSSYLTYDEMLPGSPEAEELFSIELFPTVSRSTLGSTESTGSSLSEGKCVLNLKEKSQNSIKEAQPPYDNPKEREKVPIEASGICQHQGPTNRNHIKDSVLSKEKFDYSICTICKNRRPMIGWESKFSYAELLAATNGFSPENLISRGGYADVFKGKLDNILMVAIKEQKGLSFEGENKFKSEIRALKKTRHKNVVMLLGSCLEERQRLLVYEYVCNGSLDNHLSNHSCRPLTWGERLKIALGASRGLNHLHENNIIHRDIRPKNILVNHDHEPLLGGFGLAITQYESDQSSDQCVIGTFGYLAPEYAETGKASKKTDVYSFGVVLLELITGRNTTDKRLGDKSLQRWARPLFKERKYYELIDPRIVDSHDDHIFTRMVHVAEKCLTKDPQKRLSMIEVVSTLEHIVEEKMYCGIEERTQGKKDSLRRI